MVTVYDLLTQYPFLDFIYPHNLKNSQPCFRLQYKEHLTKWSEWI